MLSVESRQQGVHPFFQEERELPSCWGCVLSCLQRMRLFFCAAAEPAAIRELRVRISSRQVLVFPENLPLERIGALVGGVLVFSLQPLKRMQEAMEYITTRLERDLAKDRSQGQWNALALQAKEHCSPEFLGAVVSAHLPFLKTHPEMWQGVKKEEIAFSFYYGAYIGHAEMLRYLCEHWSVLESEAPSVICHAKALAEERGHKEAAEVLQMRSLNPLAAISLLYEEEQEEGKE